MSDFRKTLESQTGKSFNRLTIIEILPAIAPRKPRRVRCKCKCGNMIIAAGSSVVHGMTKSCGCLKHESTVKRNIERTGRIKRFDDSCIGKQFGLWTIIAHAFHSPRRGHMVRCKCCCGTERVHQLSLLLRDGTDDCGCVTRAAFPNKTRTHGRTGTIEHRIWKDMRRRCNNPERPDYERYGGRGIKVCERWARFQNFLEDMGPRPSSSYSIERKDNDGDYEPSNCVWATDDVQRNNKRTSHRITINGETKTMLQWCRLYNVAYPLVSDRIRVLGWPAEKALTTPPRHQKRRPRHE